jgi:hypothetical protein
VDALWSLPDNRNKVLKRSELMDDELVSAFLDEGPELLDGAANKIAKLRQVLFKGAKLSGRIA